jgi:hypothetical protein
LHGETLAPRDAADQRCDLGFEQIVHRERQADAVLATLGMAGR